MPTWPGIARVPAAAEMPPPTSSRRALVTGAAGFVGQWLCRDLVRQGWAVTGTSLTGAPPEGVLSAEDHALVAWRHEDLRDAGAVHHVLKAAQPAVIFHLAGVSYVPAAGDDPLLALDVNTGVAVRLLREVRERRLAGTLDPVILLVGSGEQYGRHDALAMPLGEEAECRPCTLYAATKMSQEVFALEAFRADGVRVVCTRSFNHSGRGQARSFLLPSLVARALSARGAPLRGAAQIAAGNLDVVRDFLHVEDVVRAYVLLADRGLAGEVYNVSSGEGVTVGAIAQEVLRAVSLDAELVSDASLRRAVDVPILVGRNQKLRADTGWVPRRTRSDIIQDLVHAASL